MLPAEVHARFQEIVARARAKPLNDCPPATIEAATSQEWGIVLNQEGHQC